MGHAALVIFIGLSTMNYRHFGEAEDMKTLARSPWNGSRD